MTTDFPGCSGSDAQDVLVQPDGKIVSVGSSGGDFALVRYNPDGSLDGSFGQGGRVTTDLNSFTDALGGAALQPDGRIVAAGSTLVPNLGNQFGLVRYNANGSLDASFGSGGRVTTDFGPGSEGARAVALQPDGRIVAAGIAGPPSPTQFALARYLP